MQVSRLSRVSMMFDCASQGHSRCYALLLLFQAPVHVLRVRTWMLFGVFLSQLVMAKQHLVVSAVHVLRATLYDHEGL